MPPSASSKRPSLLQVTVSDDGVVDQQAEVALIVVVMVIDSRAPEVPDMMRTNATVIGVSAGVATAEQLAQVAVAASSDGRESPASWSPTPTRPTARPAAFPTWGADAAQAAQPPEGHSNHGDQTVNDQDHTFAWPSGMDGDLPERLWIDDGPAWPEESDPASVGAGLVSFAFIRAALRRGAKLCCAIAVLGLLIGSAFYVKYPPAYHATASVCARRQPQSGSGR